MSRSCTRCASRCRPAGVRVESTKGEWGKGQHEVNFVYDQPLPMADGHCVFKQGAKEIAEQHGKCLSFMPKIFADEAGNSCHIHISIWRGRREPASGTRRAKRAVAATSASSSAG